MVAIVFVTTLAASGCSEVNPLHQARRAPGSSMGTPTAPPTPVSGPAGSPTGGNFAYGFDFAKQGPYSHLRSHNAAVRSARRVLTSIPGMFEDTAIMDWGLPDPEPSPGLYNLSGIASRINLIVSTGGTPVVTLCAAPDWMKDVIGPDVAPTPAHYDDFANLAAKIAHTFPQVKYFVVWNELKGFYEPASKGWNIEGYTEMYNDVYLAIKHVRPDALVGGPYATLPTYENPQAGDITSTPHGPWGYVKQHALDALSYWLANNVGANFVAVDGSTVNAPSLSDPQIATAKFAAVDLWLRQRTSLPIWWMESHVQPSNSGWTPIQAAAVRVATLVQMASSGASVGMQWQPQEQGVFDEGLWTPGGQPTPLAQILPGALAVLRSGVVEVAGQPAGVLVVQGPRGTMAINTLDSPATARVNGAFVSLTPGQVKVQKDEFAHPEVRGPDIP